MTHWQDIAFSLGSLLFIIALLPSLLDTDAQVPVATSMLTGGVLGAFALTYLTLGLVFSAVTSTLLSASWLFIAWKRRL